MYVRIALTVLLAALGMAVGCSASSKGKKGPSEQELTLFVTTELKGTIEPCGCNTDPLGDIARTAELVTSVRERGRPVLVVDGGSLLYTETEIPEHLAAQEALKADLIHDIYTNMLQAAGVGLGPYDLAAGPAKVRPPRQAANLSPEAGIALEAPKVVEVGQAKVGIFGVVSPQALEIFDVEASDPGAAAKRAVAGLRKQGAHLVVGLAHMTQAEAVRLARSAPGIDILVVGQNAPEPPRVSPGPKKVGKTFLVSPANRGQVVSRLDITVRGDGSPLVDAVGEARAAVEAESLKERISALEADLAKWKQDPSADPEFVAAKEREAAELAKRRASLMDSPLQAPKAGSYFTLEQVRIRKALDCHPEIQQAKQEYDQAAGKANVEAAAGKKPPPPAPGKPGFVGVEECEMCHDEAAQFWRKTKHFEAWETLETLGKQFDYECISCHVTGWDQPGGATLAHNEHLRDVQCETCHGAGSIHVAEEDPDAIRRTPPVSLCVTCHNSKHSDTFQYEAYLRDVTGEGHGEEFREELGDGPTGHELRSAALEKAGRKLGANCVK